MTKKLAKLNYRDTGFLSNATKDEKNRMIPLSIYYQIGQFNPSKAFIKNSRNKDIIKLFKKYTEEKLLKTNALTQIYIYTSQVEEHMKLDKTKSKNKSS